MYINELQSVADFIKTCQEGRFQGMTVQTQAVDSAMVSHVHSFDLTYTVDFGPIFHEAQCSLALANLLNVTAPRHKVTFEDNR